jgi:hypothetical protein
MWTLDDNAISCKLLALSVMLGVEFGAIGVELGQRGLGHTEEDPVIDPFNYGSDAFSSHYAISSVSAGVVNAG